MQPRVALLFAECETKSRSSDFTNEINGRAFVKCV